MDFDLSINHLSMLLQQSNEELLFQTSAGHEHPLTIEVYSIDTSLKEKFIVQGFGFCV